MRLFALEKFSGTFETLMTAPVSDREVVLAKFTAALVFYMIMWLPCWLPAHRRHYTNDPSASTSGAVGSTFLGFLLWGACSDAGLLRSAMTRSQVTAAMISLVFGATLFLVGVLSSQLPLRPSWQTQVLAALSFFEQMHDFARG